MAITYTAAELLEIAQQMERNGFAFYDQAAQAAAAAEAADGKAAGLFRQLAEMERAHERTFAAMAADLPSEEADAAFDPDGQAAQYVRAVAGGQVFDLTADPTEWLAGGRTVPDILRKAIGLERDTIIYYLGVRDVMQGAAREGMDAVIDEEKNHVVVLTEQLQEVQAG